MAIPGFIQDTSSTDLMDIQKFISDHPTQHKLAKIISNLFSPPVLGTASIVLFAIALRSAFVWLWTGLFLVLCVGIPSGYVAWLARTGRVSDFHIPIRSQRIKPMILMLVMCLISTIFLLRFHPPALLVGFAVLGLAIMVSLFIVTLKWKISGHATTAAAFCSICLLSFGGMAGFSFFLVPLVIWARVRLKRHTIRQTIAGTALGLSTLTLLILH